MNQMLTIMRTQLLFFIALFVIACSPSSRQNEIAGARDTIIATASDTGMYRPGAPLDAWARFWHLDTLDRDRDAFGFRMWFGTSGGLTVLTIQEKNERIQCYIKTFKSISRDTIIIRRTIDIDRPFSGWIEFLDSLRRFSMVFPATEPLYFRNSGLTEGDGVEVERISSGSYSYRRYISPEYFRHVSYECMQVTALIQYLEFELGVKLYDGWKDQFKDQRSFGVDSAFQHHPLYHLDRSNLEGSCTQEIRFAEVPESISIFTAFNFDVYNSTNDTLEYYIGLDEFFHGVWRASFLDIDGRPPSDQHMIHKVAGNSQDRAMYEDIFASFGMGSNFKYLLDGRYRLVIYYRHKGDTSFKRCTGGSVKIKNRVDIYSSSPRINSVTIDTISSQ